MMTEKAEINMIKQQLRTGNVLNESILKLFEKLPRNLFVPESYTNFAYSDLQIPLEFGERMMTPLEEGLLLQALALKGHETILEVGTGSGFLTSLLSLCCKKVISLDYYSKFTEAARLKLTSLGCNNVELITGNASHGFLDAAPYDVIVFTGSLETISEIHRLQVQSSGKIFAIIGKEPIMQGQLHSLDKDSNWHTEVFFETNLPPLIDKMAAKEFVF